MGESENLIQEFKEYFENEKIKKVWHNYSFDRHILYNHLIDAKGFGGDTMHMARLWDTGSSSPPLIYFFIIIRLINIIYYFII